MTWAEPRRLLIFGHGYSAAALSPRLIARGWQVAGTTRGAGGLAPSGARLISWDDADAIRAEIARASAMLGSIAPEAGVDPVLARFGDALDAARPGWIGYLSSTNIYGDHAGAWVDENTPPAPATARGHARRSAEEGWTDLARRAGSTLAIFRLAGIYGPGRGPFQKLREGRARRIIKPGQVFSRIHVDDIAGAVTAALDRRAAGLFNLCDDTPAPPEDVITAAARLLALPPPPPEDFATAAMTPMARSFYAESKRVSNARMKRVLGYALRHPDYHSGLAAILAAESPSPAPGP
ncbi:MAG: SDR family oxidoreductase [Paracoccus sp. (in: a-proteobacteria)]|nr:SDR family oxidoreductase [Paracoccus sp. (in: a-proteobacteria)]